jgi:hypothetical protein
MSHDATFILRSGGQTRFFYDRWGALGIDRVLLHGPEATIEHYQSWQRVDDAVSVPWLCGAVLVDRDRHRLLFWANQFFGRSPCAHRIYRLALGHIWAGWSLGWAARGGLDFAAELGRALDDLEPRSAQTASTDAAELRAQFDGPWNAYRSDPSFEDDIASLGPDVVRSWAEWDFDTWVSVKWPDGRIDDHRLPRFFDHVLSLGPALLEALDGRPVVSLASDAFREHWDTPQTAFIDTLRRTIDWWELVPPWVGRAWERSAWPGWQLTRHDGGPLEHMQLTGRPIDAIRAPPDEARRVVDEALASCLGASFDPAMVLAREAARLAAEHPGSRVVYERPRTAAPGPDPDPGELTRLFHALALGVSRPARPSDRR